MGTAIRVVAGSAGGPTAVASYDAALADAGVHEYNLLTLSSVVPPDAYIEVRDVAPDLGPVGGTLTVVQARATVEGTGRATAALGWTRRGDRGAGVFYETGGEFDPAEARRRIGRGLEHAREIRSRDLGDTSVEVESEVTDGASFATAVVVAVYGEAEPIA
ncbi:MAG: pyruvoyl-dependent arginine decarboxylase [Halobacteriales archaeon]